MAKRHRTWNEQKYWRYIKEGRGQGTLSAYKPWIMIHDFPSLGMVSRVFGNTTGRIHHLLSNMELSYFYILDWSDKVYDIREQYPLLDIAAVLEIADKAGIRYPFDNDSKWRNGKKHQKEKRSEQSTGQGKAGNREEVLGKAWCGLEACDRG